MQRSSVLAVPTAVLAMAVFALRSEPRHTFADLDQCPAVASVATVPADGKPTQRIIHILDRHYVSRERFDLDLRDAAPHITDGELVDAWEQFLLDVAGRQRQQVAILHWIVDRTDVRAMRGKIYELITYLLRNYVVESLSDKENIRRIQNLKRLNMVLHFIQGNYSEPISIQTLAELIHLSEYRFCHLFKESMGQSPLSYINEVRLKKAHYLLEQKELTVSEVAAVVGFQDYNNFGRLFRKYFGYAPSHVWS